MTSPRQAEGAIHAAYNTHAVHSDPFHYSHQLGRFMSPTFHLEHVNIGPDHQGHSLDYFVLFFKFPFSLTVQLFEKTVHALVHWFLCDSNNIFYIAKQILKLDVNLSVTGVYGRSPQISLCVGSFMNIYIYGTPTFQCPLRDLNITTFQKYCLLVFESQAQFLGDLCVQRTPRATLAGAYARSRVSQAR